jgi:radical SAM-linked protein
MKFIGHLDVMRYFQKMFRRADIDNEYSKGFSPHQIMSFAAPLGVGLTSDGEYLDVELKSSEAPEVMIQRINAASTEGFKIIDFHPLLDPEENKKVITAMSLVASADYLVSLKDGYSLGEIKNQEEFKNNFEKFLMQQEIVIDKKTKKSEMAVDIRPLITLAAFEEKEYEDKLIDIVIPESDSVKDVYDTGHFMEDGYNKPESVADVYENGIKIYLQVSTGSAANLKPELVLEAFYQYLGLEFNEYAWQVHRIEVYTRDGESDKLISLDRMER